MPGSLTLQDTPPESQNLTPYDRAHMTLYLRLLDAWHEKADWREVVRVLFERDPDIEPDKCRRMHDSHLARARWMTEKGYHHILREDRSES